MRIFRVLIDPGHAPGNANRGSTTYREYAGMWKLSNFLKDILTSFGIHAELTRTVNQDPSLAARGGMARGFDLFISQHSNAFNGQVRGSECFFSVLQPENRVIAARFSENTALLMNHPDRGAKTRMGNNNQDFFGVIRAAVAAGCPRVFLMESGFHDNPIDEAFLLQDLNLMRIADVQADIILDVFGVGNATHKQPTQPSVQLPVGHIPSVWAREAWAWAFANGITDGTNPQEQPTREQMMQLLFNYHQFKQN